MKLNQLFKRAAPLNARDLLRGCSPGPMQSVGLMQVIPLLSELEDDAFVSPAEALVGTAGYGNLVVENPSDRLLLVPCHAGYIVRQRAQNHAMAEAGLVAARKRHTFDNAMCIQQSQGGYIEQARHKLLILPQALRELALAKREQKEFGKLWQDISAFNQTLGLAAQGHLEYFLSHFKRELDQFVAEFERLLGQVGAIVLSDGELAGIERTPSRAYFAGVWEALIRECYGSLAIARIKAKAADGGNDVPITRVALELEAIGSLSDLQQALERARERERDLVKAILDGLLDTPFERQLAQELSGYKLETLSNAQLTGQALLKGEAVVYASLTTRKTWAAQKPWVQAKAFSL